MATKVPAQLKEIADQVTQGSERRETVRTLLSWFGAERRGYWRVRQIRKALNKAKLKTEPDFEEAWIDASIVFVLKLKAGKTQSSEESSPKSDADSGKGQEISDLTPVSKKVADDATNRIKIGMLAAANRPPLCVSPDTTVSEAITLMLQHDYSQLPVTTTVRDVKGIFSWKSLGSRLALGKQCEKVSECMEAANEIRLDASLFEAIQQIVEYECVLVRDGSRKLTGIVTTADLSLQFAQLENRFFCSARSRITFEISSLTNIQPRNWLLSVIPRTLIETSKMYPISHSENTFDFLRIRSAGTSSSSRLTARRLWKS